MLEFKYFKPLSLSWWGGIAALIIAAQHAKNGDLSGAAQLATGGITAIGLRGALGTAIAAVQSNQAPK